MSHPETFDTDTSTEDAAEFTMTTEIIPVESIRASRSQARTEFDTESLERLGRTIEEYGLINPIMVRAADADADAEYELVAGERRVRAARIVGVGELPAVVTDADADEQQVLGLIENLHRRDLSTVEKARGVYQRFAQRGWVRGDEGDEIGTLIADVQRAEEISSVSESVENVKDTGSVNIPTRIAADVTENLSVSCRAVQRWLRHLQVSPEIQQEEIDADRKGERASVHTVSRIATIDDHGTQEDVYEIVRKQHLPQNTASKLVTQVKKLDDDDPLRARVLDADDDVNVHALEHVTEMDDPDLADRTYAKVQEQRMDDDEAEEFVAAVQQMDADTREDVLEPGVRVDPDTLGVDDTPRLTPQEREELRERIEASHERFDEILNDPAVIERGNLRRNWQAHKEVEARYYDLQCPACEADADSLRWSCCDLSVPDASKLAAEQYQRSIDNRPNDESYDPTLGSDDTDGGADAGVRADGDGAAEE